MKPKSLFIIASLVLAMTTGCKDGFKSVFKPNPTTAITVIGDETDSGLPKAKPQEILNLYQITDKNIYNGYNLRYRKISNVSLMQVHQFQVKPESMWLADDDQRIRELKAFRSEVSDLFNAVNEEIATSKQQSLVYEAISTELNNLAETKSEVRTCIIYSDMLDHNDVVSFYAPQTLQLAHTHPEQLAARLESITPLKPLNGIEVYIVYTPCNYEQQKRFDAAIAVYKILLESKHAKVHIVANIINEEG